MTVPDPDTQNSQAFSTPISGRSRIELVDILRGFAIFGILAVNMFSFAGVIFNYQSEPDLLDKIVIVLVMFLFQAKFYSLFSLLFGWGMSIQMERAAAKGTPFVPVYIRRQLILLAFGLIHGIFIWPGDILTNYAFLGLFLLLFRKSSKRTLLIGVALSLLLAILVVVPGTTMDALRQVYADLTEFMRNLSDVPQDIFGRGAYGEITERRASEFIGAQSWFIYWIGNVFAMFLLGLYFGKRRLFQETAEKLPLFRWMNRLTLVVGLLFGAIWVVAAIRPDTVPTQYQRFVVVAGRTIGAPALMLFYVSGITLLVQKENWHRRLAPLAPVGRMALTNYILQSVVATLIFYSYGLGLYREFSPLAGLVTTILIFFAQIRFSAWWLERYRFGPMEWLWRTLTYGRLQPLRRNGGLEDARTSPKFGKVRRVLTGINPLVYLAIIWIGLMIWTFGLINWQYRLDEEAEDVAMAIAALTSGDHDGQSRPADDLLGESVSSSEALPLAESAPAISTPEVRAIDYDPGPIAAGGDMAELAAAFDVDFAIEQIEVLASPAFMGRMAGSSGGRAAAEYIAEQFAANRLQPAGDAATFFQEFPITYTLITEVPSLAVTAADGSVTDSYVIHRDFAPVVYSYSGGGEEAGQVYWLNHCLPDDFYGRDVVGKIAFCSTPGSNEELAGMGRHALEHGAVGLLLLTPPDGRPPDFGNRFMEVWVPEPIPSLRVYSEVTADLFAGSGVNVADPNEMAQPLLLKTRVSMVVNTSENQRFQARNVLGVLPGRDPAYRSEVVILGAHYDHLGQTPDGTIWSGANDNASGVASLIEIARSWAEQGYVPRRSVLFAAWDAEEWGLLGSVYYVNNPRYPLEDTQATLQMDMVGAGVDTLNIAGDQELSRQLYDIAESLGVEAAISDLGRSDHVPFQQAGIPSGLIIWIAEDEGISHYHRPADVVEIIERDKLAAAGAITSMTLLNLVETEPAIESLLAERAAAILVNDSVTFLSTSHPDQLATDRFWFDGLRSFEPTRLNMRLEDLHFTGDSAAADVTFDLAYPDEGSSDGIREFDATMPVRFLRDGNSWQWAGPDLILARPTVTQTTAMTRTGLQPFEVAYPASSTVNPFDVGLVAASQYREINDLLNLNVQVIDQILLMPDTEAIRVSTSLSLPPDTRRWVASGQVKLLFSPEISRSAQLEDAMAQLLLADMGLNEEIAPWLWHGLPWALQAEDDLVTTQSRLLPELPAGLRSEEGQPTPATAWAAIDYLQRQIGWPGVGQFIDTLGRSCRQGSCDATALDSTLGVAIGMDSETFEESWRADWLQRLDSVQAGLDDLMTTRETTVLIGDEPSFLKTLDPTDLALVSAEQHWFSDLAENPVSTFSLSAEPAALLPGGNVLANVNMRYQLAEVGAREQNVPLSIELTAIGDGYQWAGLSMDSLSGSSVTLRYPEGEIKTAEYLLAESEFLYARLAQILGVAAPDPLIIELFTDAASFRAANALSFPDSSWITAWSGPGTAIKLRKLPSSTDEDYRADLTIQLARQLMLQLGVNAEWLLKGASTYLARSLDGGISQRAATAALPEIYQAAQDGTLVDLAKLPADEELSQEEFARSGAQAWDSVRFLVDTYGRQTLIELLHRQGRDGDVEGAVRDILGQPLTLFASEWTASLRKGHAPAGAMDLVFDFDGQSASEFVAYLAGPALAGRQAGSDGANQAAEEISDHFAELGLLPVGDSEGISYFQPFIITRTVRSADPFFSLDGDLLPFTFRDEFLIARATIGEGEPVTGELIWVGENVLEATYLDGKIMVTRPVEGISAEIDRAVALGAGGLILLTNKEEEEDLFAKHPLTAEDIAEIPVIELTLAGTLRLLRTWGEEYRDTFARPGVEPMDMGAQIISTLAPLEPVQTANVLGLLPGRDPALAVEVIILGAHYDYVGDDPGAENCAGEGMDHQNNMACQTGGRRYGGANDNASGVAVMLEIARLWQQGGYRPARSVLFAAWGAQELGQLGSSHYVLSPTVSLTQTLAVIQLDGVGGGNGFFPGMQGDEEQDAWLLHHAQAAADLLAEKIIVTPDFANSDHQSFDEAGLPTLLFSWRLANEDNLPDGLANGISGDRLAVTGRLVALTLMMLAW